ncbi:MAG: CocE/NonD family hydrolase, partial [Pseudomonadota bacterium]
MRDGVTLATDVYLPEGTGPFPTLLERTPYGRRRCDQSEQITGAATPPERAEVVARTLDEGFAVIVQDCRGSGASGGRFDKYTQEPDDSADTIAWAKAQPWCGPLRTTGFSYGAMWQLCALAKDDHGIDAAFIDCGGFYDAFASALRQGGALDLKQATWAMAQAARESQEKPADADTVFTHLMRGPWGPGDAPLADDSPYLNALNAFWQNATRSPFWDHPAFHAARTIAASLGTPAFFVTSWHDTSLVNVVSAFAARARLGEREQSLIIGPWSHGNRHLTHAGEADFGEEALPEVGLGATFQDLRLAFLARPRAPTGPPVRVFVMGGGTGRRNEDGRIDHGGRWHSAPSWPPAHKERVLSLGPAGLGERAPSAPFSHTFISDPHLPVPTLGGAINSGEPVMAGGMFDHTTLFPVADGESGRADVLSFLTAPLAEDLVIAGPVSAHLWVSAEVADCDVTIKLIDVYPGDGPALNLCDGILRLRFRDGF